MGQSPIGSRHVAWKGQRSLRITFLASQVVCLDALYSFQVSQVNIDLVDVVRHELGVVLKGVALQLKVQLKGRGALRCVTYLVVLVNVLHEGHPLCRESDRAGPPGPGVGLHGLRHRWAVGRVGGCGHVHGLWVLLGRLSLWHHPANHVRVRQIQMREEVHLTCWAAPGRRPSGTPSPSASRARGEASRLRPFLLGIKSVVGQ